MTEIMKQQPEGEILLYQTEDGQTRIDVRMVGETVWLSLILFAMGFALQLFMCKARRPKCSGARRP